MTARLAILLMLACTASVASGPPDPGTARFYAAGLDRPLLQLRAGALLIEACKNRLRRACSREQRELAAGDRTIQLLDTLTLFPQRPVENPATGISRSQDLARKIDETSAALLREAFGYDRQLFARFGAALQACPDDDAAQSRESLSELVRIDLAGFQSLADDDLVRAMAEIARDENEWAARLRAASPEECRAALGVGEYLMQLMHSKLQPWSGEDQRVSPQEPKFEFGAAVKPAREVPAREIAHAVAGNFVAVVAAELEITAFPESEARIRAVGETGGSTRR